MKFPSFSRVEIRDILISLLVLTVVFSYPEFLFNPLFFLVSLLTVGLAFIGHELSHRFTARRLGFWSEYRMWPQGLFLAFFLAIASGGTFIFAAPGAVVFSGYLVFRRHTKRDVGKIGISGPVFNMVLMYVSLGLYFYSRFFLFKYMALVNGWLGIFNLIPFNPLDGYKVFRWSWRIWLLAIIVALAGFILISVV